MTPAEEEARFWERRLEGMREAFARATPGSEEHASIAQEIELMEWKYPHLAKE